MARGANKRRVWVAALVAALGALGAYLAFSEKPLSRRTFGPIAVQRVSPTVIPGTPPRLYGTGGVPEPRASTPASEPRVQGMLLLTVRVEDTHSLPLAGASVEVALEASPPRQGMTDRDVIQRAVTDPHGSATVGAPQDRPVRVLAAASGYLMGEVHVATTNAVPVGPVVIKLRRGRQVRGTVRLPSGGPVPDIHVVVIARAQRRDAPDVGLLPLGNGWWSKALTDKRGDFTAEGVGPGPYLIRVDADGWSTLRAQSRGENADEVDVVAQPVRLVCFEPVDARSRLPVTLNGIGIEFWGTEPGMSTRSDLLTGRVIFSSTGMLNAYYRPGVPSILQAILFDDAAPPTHMQALIHWTSTDEVYLPVIATLRLRKPDEYVRDPTADEVPLTLHRPDDWCSGLSVTELWASRDIPPARSCARYLVLHDSAGRRDDLLAWGVQTDGHWHYGPLPRGLLTGRVHAGTWGSSDEFPVDLQSQQPESVLVRFPPVTGFRLHIATDWGFRDIQPESVVYTKLTSVGGEEVDRNSRVSVPYSELEDVVGREEIIHAVPAGGAYRVSVVHAGYEPGNVDFTIPPGDIVDVDVSLQRKE